MRRILLSLFLALAACTPANLAERPSTHAYQYTLGSGDRLKVETYGEQRLTGEFAVNGEGKVSFPLLGEVEARGKTLAQFKADLIGRLGNELLRNPQVTVEMLNLRPVYVLGEVARPGEFPFAEHMTIYALVAKAGGFTYRANREFAYVTGEGDADEQATRLTSTTAVHPGDTIRIPERTF